jgi:hypothetical protein
MNISGYLSVSDTVGLKILAEYDVLNKQFSSPKQFARYIALTTRMIIDRDIPHVDFNHVRDEKQIQLYRQFLITRARASGMRSLDVLQEWYLDTFAELHKISLKVHLPEKSLNLL